MKKVIWIDPITSMEAETYVYSSEDSSSSFEGISHLVLTESDGFINPNLIRPVAEAEAAKVTIRREALGTISRGDVVRSVEANVVSRATPDISKQEATALGIALSDAVGGEQVAVLILGIIVDPLFAVFSVQTPLYLDVDGGVTDERRNTGYLTYIGKCLGGGEVLVDVGQPIVLGV